MVSRADHARTADAISPFPDGPSEASRTATRWIIVAGAIGGTAHGDGRNAIGFAACASTVLNLAAS
jgi:hypothetical protein